MNPYLILGAVLFWVVSSGAVYVKGQSVGANRVIAEQAKVNKAIDETRAAAQEGAANAIAQIKVVNTTVKGRVETIVRENTVYRDCKHDARSLRDINAAITGDPAEPAGAGKLPEAGAPKR
jgi:hypothetical protein